MPDAPDEIQTTLRTAYTLLQSGQYDQIDALLYSAQVASNQLNDTFATTAVAAARQIYAAYLQCHTDIEWYEQVGSEARKRERQLRQHVQSLLAQLSGPIAEPPTEQILPHEPLAETTPSGLLSTLWLYLQNLLQRFKLFFASRQEIPPQPLAQKLEEATPVSAEVETMAPVSPVVEIIEPTVELQAPVIEPALPVEQIPEPTVQRAQALYTLVIYCFGSFRVYQHDQLIEEWNGLKGQAVLKYLIARRGTPISKDTLMDIFWPDAEPEAARRNLHQAIYSLRQTLRRGDPGVQYIRFENNQYLLNPELSVWIDCEDFEIYTQNGRRLAAAGQLAEAMSEYNMAEQLYQGDFLTEDVYEDWPRAQRERLRTLYMEMANQLSEYQLQQGIYATVNALCQKILTLDNCFEEAHRRLMRMYVTQGQRHLAIRQYQTCVQALTDELDVPPSEETVALYEQIIANN